MSLLPHRRALGLDALEHRYELLPSTPFYLHALLCRSSHCLRCWVRGLGPTPESDSPLPADRSGTYQVLLGHTAEQRMRRAVIPHPRMQLLHVRDRVQPASWT